MADMESICSRLCLLTHAAWRDGLPAPFKRASVQRMVRLGMLEGLTLREVPGIKDEYYDRAKSLLARSADIYEAVNQSKAQGYDILLPQDDAWPVNLCALGIHMPQFLFVRGNVALFLRRTVAVAGSREIEKTTEKLAEDIGTAIAREGCVLVCGGAQGVDSAVQRACLAEGGSMILVPAKPCQDLLRQEYLQIALEEGRLLIACDAWPEERFSGIKALARNHAIYALGDAAIAVASKNGSGGTWNGASACLHGGYTPVFVPDESGSDFDGNHALLHLGAKRLYFDGLLGDQLFAEGM